MKRVWIMSFLLIWCFSIYTSVSAQTNEVVIQNGVVKDGRTLVPLRAIFEELDAEVEWNQKTETVTATRGNTKISLKIGSKTATINGKTLTIDVPAQLHKNRTYVPLRFVSESLGADVEWNKDRLTSFIISGDKKITVEVDEISNRDGNHLVVYRNDQLGFLLTLDEQMLKSLVIKDGQYEMLGIDSVEIYFKDETLLNKNVFICAIYYYPKGGYHEDSLEILLESTNKRDYVLIMEGQGDYMHKELFGTKEFYQYAEYNNKLREYIPKVFKAYN